MATYRIQLNKNFDFYKLKAIVPYLAQLGISHIYASPIFQAKKSSTHGYDITDPNQINEELGGAEGFQEATREAKAYGLGWLQDIVPNHVAFSLENPMVYDAIEKGTSSHYSKFLDVNWNYPSPRLNGRILTPFLAKHFADCLKQGETTLTFEKGFKIKYGSLKFPVNPATAQQLSGKPTQETLNNYNGNPDRLAHLLSKQAYALAYWKAALKQINYRRFFDIIDLIGLRMEEQGVFEETHQLSLELLKAGKISALRVDHIDGLFKPEEYLQKLRKHAPDAYVIVEKILTGAEELPDSWPVEGNTGYDFVNCVNGLFVAQEKEKAIDEVYKRFTGNTQAFSELLYNCKRFVIENYFMGDAKNLSRLILQALREIQGGKFNFKAMTDAIVELFACFPVYRTYLNPTNTSVEASASFCLALAQAKQKKPSVIKELGAVEFLLNLSGSSDVALEALMRLQQFTGSVMAKGLEDTAFYRYCRLLSLNEVGGNPAKFGVSAEEVQRFNAARQSKWPLSLNASSTHDTKRGEDCRARLNVLSETPQELEKHLKRWAEVNAKEKAHINGRQAPDANEEYFVYQTLLAAYPFEEAKMQDFAQRLTAYMVKALREAKVNSSWIAPNVPYEEAATQFVTAILQNKHFLYDFLPFQKQIARYGVYNSLAQTLLKIACPGIPDFYQGSELWNLSMVDPDNRRPVDFQLRQKLLAEVSASEPSNSQTYLENYESGKAKLYVIFKALQVRRRLKGLFEEGTYLPLKIEGELSKHLFAFAKSKGDQFVIVVVPRFVASLLEPSLSWSEVDWEDTSLTLPNQAPASYIEMFTGARLHSNSGRLLVSEVLSDFPVALLAGGDSS